MKDGTLILLLAEALLGVYVVLPWSDPTSRAVALGALVGVIGGHLNGSRSGSAASGPSVG